MYYSQSDIDNMLEVVFLGKGVTSNYDTRKTNNRSDKKAPKTIVEGINNSLTIETIEALIGKNFPLFKYKTQITIHGDFGKLDATNMNRVTVNGNGSVGVKWVAIDSEKMQTLRKKLAAVGISYFENSSKRYFEVFNVLGNGTEGMDKFLATIERCKGFINGLDKANGKDLFWGNYSLRKGLLMGTPCTIFTLTIDAIYDKNIDAFLDAIGCTKAIVDAYEAKKLAEQKAYEAKLEAEKSEKEIAAAKEREEKAPMIAIAQAILKEPRFQGKLIGSRWGNLKASKEGESFIQILISKESIKYFRWDIFMADKRAKKPSYSKTEFATLDIALAATVVIDKYSDKLDTAWAQAGSFFRIVK